MKSLTDTFMLNNGVQIPCVGFGTWQTPDGDAAERAVIAALSAGYRHIDTAAAYGNEKSVGDGIRKSGVNRADIFITTKLGNPHHGYEATKEAFERSLELLGLEYLDLYLIHWPNPKRFRDCWEEMNAGTWRAFEQFYAEGRLRALGISNFLPHHIDALMKTAKIAPAVNQIRLCPGETMDETVKYCAERNILLEAYSPLGTGSVFEVQAMKDFAAKYGRTIAQICLRWSLQMGFLPLPKSVTESRIIENAQLFDFELSDEDVKIIAALTDCCDSTKLPHPDEAPF